MYLLLYLKKKKKKHKQYSCYKRTILSSHDLEVAGPLEIKHFYNLIRKPSNIYK